MFEYETPDYESDTFDSSEEDDDVESASSFLDFGRKITDEMKMLFKRNCENDDYCDDIYDNKFETPKSGSHSYYSDILAVAQLNERNDGCAKFCTRSRGHQRSTTTIHPSTWICTGQWSPETGIGPFEELFKVLEHHRGFSRPGTSDQTALSPLYYPQEWEPNSVLSPSYDEDLIGVASINSDYPSFIDSFQRWSNNSCSMLPSTNQNNFMPYDYHSSF